MSDFPTLASMTAGDQSDLRNQVGPLARSMAARMADPQSRSADQRPVAMGRRMAVVTAVTVGPPLTADVLLDTETIPGASPQATYRPQVGDLVWLEILGTDAHISPPLASGANQAWNPLTLQSGWSPYLTGGWTLPPTYWRDAQGFVHLQGSVALGANNSYIAYLPPGFHKAVSYSGHAVSCHDGVGPAYGVVAIAGDGGIFYQGPNAPVQVALDGVHFRID